ncbi:MAG: hypothetical protein J7527_09510, partial [Chitinophagaceae bacterium]|nr:hypothetical protein [Chitinophagaceae bacterium]
AIWLYTSVQTSKISLRYVKKGPFKVWSGMTTDEKREVRRLTRIAVVSFIIMLCLVIATFFINSRLSAE